MSTKTPAIIKQLKQRHAPSPFTPILKIEAVSAGTGLLINTGGFESSLGALSQPSDLLRRRHEGGGVTDQNTAAECSETF